MAWYHAAVQQLYICPALNSTNYPLFQRVTCSTTRRTDLAKFIRVLDLSRLQHAGKKSNIARLLHRARHSLISFTAPPLGFGYNCIGPLYFCSSLQRLDLSFVFGHVAFEELADAMAVLDGLKELHLPTRMSTTQDPERLAGSPFPARTTALPDLHYPCELCELLTKAGVYSLPVNLQRLYLWLDEDSVTHLLRFIPTRCYSWLSTPTPLESVNSIHPTPVSDQAHFLRELYISGIASRETPAILNDMVAQLGPQLTHLTLGQNIQISDLHAECFRRDPGEFPNLIFLSVPYTMALFLLQHTHETSFADRFLNAQNGAASGASPRSSIRGSTRGSPAASPPDTSVGDEFASLFIEEISGALTSGITQSNESHVSNPSRRLISFPRLETLQLTAPHLSDHVIIDAPNQSFLPWLATGLTTLPQPSIFAPSFIRLRIDIAMGRAWGIVRNPAEEFQHRADPSKSRWWQTVYNRGRVKLDRQNRNMDTVKAVRRLDGVLKDNWRRRVDGVAEGGQSDSDEEDGEEEDVGVIFFSGKATA